MVVERSQPDEGDAEHDSDERCRYLRNDPPHAQEHDQSCGREGHRGPAHVAEVVDDAGDLTEEARCFGITGDAEQLRDLTGGDGEPDADLDARECRLGDVVDQGAETE